MEPALASLERILIDGAEPFQVVLAIDADLVLEVGERVLEKAESGGAFERRAYPRPYGDLSIVVRFRMKEYAPREVPLFRLHSYVADVDFSVSTTPAGVRFAVSKRGTPCEDLLAPYPEGWGPGTDCVAAFLYCSRTREARTITNGLGQEVRPYDVGWVHAAEVQLEGGASDASGLIERHWVFTYGRLLSTNDVAGLLALPSDGRGLLVADEGSAVRGVFPE